MIVNCSYVLGYEEERVGVEGGGNNLPALWPDIILVPRTSILLSSCTLTEAPRDIVIHIGMHRAKLCAIILRLRRDLRMQLGTLA